VVLLDVGQEVGEPGAVHLPAVGGRVAGVDGALLRREDPEVGRQPAVRPDEAVGGDAELPEVVGAPDPVGRLAGLLDGGEEQADEDADDGDHYQQLDQREARARPGCAVHGGPQTEHHEQITPHTYHEAVARSTEKPRQSRYYE